jgi:hypothetical protein
MPNTLTRSFKYALVIVLSTVAPAIGASEGQFCSSLKKLAREAQSNFRTIMGSRTHQYRSKGKVFMEDYAATIGLPGATCEVTLDLEDRTTEYECNWHHTTTVEETIQEGQKLSQDVESCLGSRAREINLKSGARVWTIPWNQEEKGVEFRVSAGQRNSKHGGIRQMLNLSIELEN